MLPASCRQFQCRVIYGTARPPGYNLNFVQYQSRYLFTALVPISILLVRGWSALPPRPWLALALPAALIALNAYALERVLIPGFAPPA